MGLPYTTFRGGVNSRFKAEKKMKHLLLVTGRGKSVHLRGAREAIIAVQQMWQDGEVPAQS